MKLKQFKVDDLPVVVIDDFFEDVGARLILKELHMMHSELSDNPEMNGSPSGFDDEGNKFYVKYPKGLWLDQVTANRAYSDILTINRKLFDAKVTDALSDVSSFFNYIKHSNTDYTLIQYYDNDDQNPYRIDSATVTAITWFYDKPKKFIGGNLFLQQNSKNLFLCESNRTVIFPSVLEYRIDRVELDEESQNNGLGTYVMKQFAILN